MVCELMCEFDMALLHLRLSVPEPTRLQDRLQHSRVVRSLVRAAHGGYRPPTRSVSHIHIGKVFAFSHELPPAEQAIPTVRELARYGDPSVRSAAREALLKVQSVPNAK